MRKYEPPHIHKKFLFVRLIKRYKVEPGKIDLKGLLRIYPVPWACKTDLEKLKKLF